MAITDRLKARQNSGRLPSVWALWRASGRLYVQHGRRLAGIAAIVAVPYALLSLIGSSASGSLSAYASFAALLMNLAIIWAVIQISAGRRVTVKAAYYQGTVATVRFIFVTLVLVSQLLPLVLGALFFNAATLGSTAAVTLPERLLVGFLWLVLSLPSFYWLVRYSFAPLNVAESDATPVQALRASRLLVKGRFWPVFGRLAALGLTLIVATLIPTLLLVLFIPSRFSALGLSLVQLLVSLSLLPLLYLYLDQLRSALQVKAS